MSAPFADRLKAILHQIESDPSSWCQHAWHQCNTSHCFGGWAEVMAGYRRYGGNSTTTIRRARAYLNLNLQQAALLFCGYNGLDDLRRLVRCFSTGRSVKMRYGDVVHANGRVEGNGMYANISRNNADAWRDADGYDQHDLDADNLPRSRRREAYRP